MNRLLRYGRVLGLTPRALAALVALPAQAQQTLYVANPNANDILAFAAGQSTPTVFASGLNDPEGITVDSLGDVYATDGESIVKFSATGQNLGVFATAGLDLPSGLAFNSSGDLFAANQGRVTEYSSTGQLLNTYGNLGSIGNPNSQAFDKQGDLFVSNGNNGTSASDDIEEFAAGSTTPTTFATTDPNDYTFNSPYGLAFSTQGTLYVAESAYNSNTIEEYSATGQDLGTFASGLSGPAGLAFNANGDLFVANSHDNTIEEFAPSTSLNNTPIATFSTGAGNGSGLYSPLGMAFSPQTAPVPEVSTASSLGLLLMLGVGGLLVHTRTRRRRSA